MVLSAGNTHSYDALCFFDVLSLDSKEDGTVMMKIIIEQN
jgi:hypothetical protein